MKARTPIIMMVLSINICVLIGKDRDEDKQWTLRQFYEPYELNIEPNALSYALPLDINDIVNFHEIIRVIDINSISNLIRQNGFAVLEPEAYSYPIVHDFDSLYRKLRSSKIPAFITVDTGLYLYHTLLDEALKDIDDTALRDRIYNFEIQPFTVGKYGSGAYIRALDLMAQLGSGEAASILEVEVSTAYDRHESHSGKLKVELDALSHVDWCANLYWSWLHCMRALFQQVPEGYPQFTRTHAWQRRQLYAALASWTQLHAKANRIINPMEQIGTPAGVRMLSRPLALRPITVGYVEPTPVLWGRLQSLTKMVSRGLEDQGMLRPKISARLATFEGLLRNILDIVDKQLTNKPLSSEDCELFEKFPSILDDLLPGELKHGMASILTGEAMGLEQAVGDIDLLIVAYPILDGKARLAIGPVLSYYEFESKSELLTDESWRLLVDSPTRPDRPRWYSPLFRPREDFSELTRLTNDLYANSSPQWSPDRKKILFVRVDEIAGDWGIYVMNADGSQKKRLTNKPGIYLTPCWSPDGQKIAFQLDTYDKGEIYVMNADGTDLKRLTNNDTEDGGPCWSPDGKRIVFWSEGTGRGDIFVMNSDGSEQNRLTFNTVRDTSPCWSSDGRQVTFESQGYIFVMNADGSELKKITNNRDSDWSPCWSPDGKKITFMSKRDRNYEIYVMNADGSKQRRLTNNSVNDSNPCWSPDGRQIVFESSIGIHGFTEICIMDFNEN